MPNPKLKLGILALPLLLLLTACPQPVTPSEVSNLTVMVDTSGPVPSVNLNWNAISGATNYILQRKAEGGDFAELARPGQAAYTDTSGAYNTVYYYRVKANLGSSPSNWSADKRVPIGAKGSAPSPDPGAPGVPQNPMAYAVSGGVKVVWQAAAGASGYVLERRTTQGAFGNSVNLTALEYTDTNVPGGLTYSYRLRATNASGSSGFVITNEVPVAAACASPAGEASTKGCFGPVFPNWPVVPTFSALLPNGKVIGWYASDDIGRYRERTDVHDISLRQNAPKSEDGTQVAIWNPASNSFEDASFGNGSNMNRSGATKGTDLFCAGFTVLTDGRFFTAGGGIGLQWGSIHTNLFDPTTSSWLAGPAPRAPDMWRDRWYPTLTKLPDGKVLITGGTAMPMPAGAFTEGSVSSETNPCRTKSGRCPVGLASGVAGRLERGINTNNLGTAYNNSFEIYDAASGELSMLDSNASAIASFEHYYPWFHVAPNGTVVLTGAGKQKAYLDVNGDRWYGPWESTSLGIPYDAHRVYGTSVMYEPGKVLVIGGGYAADQWGGTPAQRTIVALNNRVNGKTTLHLTLGNSSSTPPTLSVGPQMAYSRTHLNATLLADGKVFVNGGQQDGGENPGAVPATPMTPAQSAEWWPKSVNPATVWNPDLAVFGSEIWTPGSPSFAPGPRAQKPRMYHSVAMLLPDATVLTAAGGGCGLCAGNIETGNSEEDRKLYGSAYGQPEKINQKNHEIYYPAYLFSPDGSPAPRPIIGSLSNTAPSPDAYPTVAYNSRFNVGWQHPDAARSIRKVTLVALGVPTHAFNQNQRFLSLDFTASGGSLEVRAPYDSEYGSPATGGGRNVAPPGFYMLFLIDDQGVPSVAKIVRVS